MRIKEALSMILGLLASFFLTLLASFFLTSALFGLADKGDKRTKLEKQFSIKIPEGDEFTAAEIVFLRPVVEKQLRKLEQDLINSCNAMNVVLDKRNELAITDAGKSLQNLKKLENEKEYAFSNLKEACEAAKYFKLVPEDCEPCKAVK